MVELERNEEGMTIEEKAAMMLEVAEIQGSFSGFFNGISLVANSGQTVESVVNQYRQKIESRLKEYQDSEAYKEFLSQYQSTVQKNQAELNYLLAFADGLMLWRPAGVMIWLEEIGRRANVRGVEFNHNRVLKALDKAGYARLQLNSKHYENCSEEEFVRKAVGQVIDLLYETQEIPPGLSVVVHTWCHKFKDSSGRCNGFFPLET